MLIVAVSSSLPSMLEEYKTEEGKTNQTKNYLGYIYGRKVCQGQFSGCRYSKVQEVLKLRLSREYPRDRITLCLPFTKHPLCL